MGKKKIAQSTTSEAQPQGEDVKAEKAAPASKRMKRLEKGKAYINATYNNTSVSIADANGGILAWATAGSLGFSGPKKATPFAASKIVSVIAEKLKGLEVGELEIFVKGIGGGRDSAIRSLANQGFNIVSIKDVTPIPHNGPRPAKTRRV
ncbi:MAG: 30S ribosomal protein S11 [Patescibacteria group bacterium]